MGINRIPHHNQLGVSQAAKAQVHKAYKVSTGAIPDTAPQEQMGTEPAVILDVGEMTSARWRELASKSVDLGFMGVINGDSINPEASTNLRLNLDEPDDLHIYRNAQSAYQEGTLECFLRDSLIGRVGDATKVACELGELIKSAQYGNGDTIEERTINREIGIKAAEYIAQNYFSNPDEAKAFMDGINKFVEYDVMREQGYTFWEGVNKSPYKSYEDPTSTGNARMLSHDFLSTRLGMKMPERPAGAEVGSAEFDKYMNEEYLPYLEKYNDALANAYSTGQVKMWQDEANAEFNNNAASVLNVINNTKLSLNEGDISSNLAKLLESLKL